MNVFGWMLEVCLVLIFFTCLVLPFPGVFFGARKRCLGVWCWSWCAGFSLGSQLLISDVDWCGTQDGGSSQREDCCQRIRENGQSLLCLGSLKHELREVCFRIFVSCTLFLSHKGQEEGTAFYKDSCHVMSCEIMPHMSVVRPLWTLTICLWVWRYVNIPCVDRHVQGGIDAFQHVRTISGNSRDSLDIQD